MFVLAIVVSGALALAVFILVMFIMIVIGLYQAHPTDLALQQPTFSAVLASRVVGLHVRRSEPVQHLLGREVAAR
jgi:hypothetical protein